jgi:glycosyltransferase involved in cell wall biosynthesis
MKILFLLTQDLESPSGLGRYAPMARELSRRGHDVCVAALHSNYESLTSKSYTQETVCVQYVAPMHVRKQASQKTYYSPLSLLAVAARATWTLSTAAWRSRADIIHIGKPHPMNSLAGLAAQRLQGRRLFLDCDDYEAGVGHFHSGWEKRGVVFFEDHMPFQVDRLTTNTHFTLQRLIDLGVPPEKITYISNGVDRSRFPPTRAADLAELRQQLGLQGKQVVAFIGSLSRPGHPVELLFAAFRSVLNLHPESILLVVGGGDDFERLQAQAAEMGIGSSVVFTGRVPADQAWRYYHLADVSVDPVLDDGAARGRSPLKLFESWACGTPFVSCDVGDRKILLGDPPAGLLARPGDADSLAAALSAILEDAALAERCRQWGLQRVESYYWDVLVKDLEQAYTRTVEAGV